MYSQSFIFRKQELNILQSAMDNVNAGIPSYFFISGSSGIGKTTLVENIKIPKTINKITTTVFDLGLPAYSVLNNFIGQVKSYFQNTDKKIILKSDLLSGFSYELPNPAENREILIKAFTEVLETASSLKPLVWIIDNMHWADLTSLEILGQALRRMIHSPLIVIACYQDEYHSNELSLRKLRTELRNLPHFSEIKLSPFSKEELEDFLVQKCKGNPDNNMLETLLKQTGGLPLYVDELLKHLLGRGFIQHDENNTVKLKRLEKLPIPESIKDILLLKLESLSDEARFLAEIAASYNFEFELSFLEKFSVSPLHIDELITAGIIYEKVSGIGTFKHILFCEIIKNDIIWSKRKSIYEKIAIELEKQNAPSQVLADFWHKAGNIEKARPALVQSAKKSCKVFAFQDAARWAEKALDNWPSGDNEEARIDILNEFAHCSKISGDITNAIKANKELLNSYLIKADELKQAEAFRELAFLYSMKGAWSLYRQSKEKAIELFESKKENAKLCIERMDLANYFLKELNLKKSLSIIDKAVDNGLLSGKNKLYVRALALKGYISGMYGEIDEGYQLASKAVNLAIRENDLLTISESYRRLAGTLEYSSLFKESVKAYEVALNFCGTNGLNSEETQCLSCMAWVFLRTGDWRKSFEISRKVMDSKYSLDISKCTALVILSLMRAYRGELKSAKHNLIESMAIARKESSVLHHLIALWPMSVIAVVEGKNDEALQHFNKMIDLWFQTEDRHDSIPGFFDAVSFYALNNNFQELNRCVDALSLMVNHTKNQEAIAVLYFALGMIMVFNKEYKKAHENFELALEYLDIVNAPLQKAIVQYHHSKNLQYLNKEKKSLEAMAEAFNAFKNLGIRFWCNLVEIEKNAVLSALKVEDLSQTSFTDKQLTQRQHEILSMLASGLSNKEIAGNLHLSTRTVDMHVRNIYDRLNCRTRTEAVRIALNKGLVAR